MAQQPQQPDEIPEEGAALIFQQMGSLEARFSREITIGPLPPPEDLAQYEQIKKGITDQLLDRMHSQISHRHGIEDRESLGKEKRKDRGQQYGFFICVLALVCAVLFAYLGFGWAGAIVGATGIGGPLTPGILRQWRASARKSRKKK